MFSFVKVTSRCSIVLACLTMQQKGNTALHIASLAGHEDIVKVLVQNGATVNVSSQVKM